MTKIFKHLRKIYLLIIAFGVFVTLGFTQVDDPGAIEIEISPPSLKIPIGGTVEATLVVRNQTEQTLADVSISQLDFPGLMIHTIPEESHNIPAKGTAIWKLRITQDGTSVVSGDIYNQITYSLVADDGTRSEQVAFKKLAVSTTDQINSNELLEIQVHSSLSKLNDFRPGYIYLEVKNKSDAAVELVDLVVAERPKFIELRTERDEEPIPVTEVSISGVKGRTLAPGESEIITLYVKAGDQIQPGKHLLVFNIFFNHIFNGEQQTGSLVVKQEVEVEVFGEGEVLGALANVTSFLLLPGFLMVVFAGMMWRLFVPEPWKNKVNVDANLLKDARFWVLAITFSLLMAWIGYPLISSWFPSIGQRSYLYGYGFQDIIWMWLFSLAIGLLFAVLVAAVVQLGKLVAEYLKERRYERAIRESDSPFDVLEKIAEQGYPVLRFKRAKAHSSDDKGYLLEEEEADKNAFWIAPRIAILWHEEDQGLMEKAQGVINDNASPAELLNILKQGLELGDGNGLAGLEWASIGSLTGPERHEKVNLEISSEEAFLFRNKYIDS